MGPQSSAGSRRVIVVCGASGAQGGSVARHLLYQQEFTVKALTRDPDSEAINQLRLLGAEVVVADFDDSESLLRAFQGAYGVFGVTKQDEPLERRTAQGKAMLDAAKRTGVQHFVWSTFPIGVDSSGFVDSRNHVDELSRSVPCTIFYPALSYSVIFNQITPSGGHWKGFFVVPLDTVLPMISTDDIGVWVSHAFSNPTEWKGKCMKPCTETMTLRQYIKEMEEYTGQPVITNEPTMEYFLASEHVIPDAWKRLRWYIEEAAAFYDPKQGRAIHPASQGWATYLDERLNDEHEPVSPVVVKMNVDVQVE